ncbi:MAG TPA: hypothetical protein VFG19_03875 [Geobacteraceae bacterium]|nr:hypothetical protein [Geobacteraceae bacterium]
MTDRNQDKYRVNVNNKADRITAFLRELIKNEFSGTISIGFNRGGITRIEKNEDILRNIL